MDPAAGGKASIARVYDALLGGCNNTDADRELANALLADMPELRRAARQNRKFVTRAVTWTASQGIAQFLDLGAGLPPPPPYRSVHDTARQQVPGAHVIYVDSDEDTARHIRLMEATVEGVAAVTADLADPASVLADPVMRECVDFSRPACVILAASLHFLAAKLAGEVVTEYMAAFPPGSALVISTARYDDPAMAAVMAEKYTAAPLFNHSREDVRGWFAAAGAELQGGAVEDVRRWPVPVPAPRRDVIMIGCVGLT